MPLRIASFRAAAHLAAAADCRTLPPPGTFSSFFHSSSVLRRDDIDSKNYYETLGVQTSASPKDIKRSFYHLSKTHHPDHNRDDPLASKRFMRISEAYSVLSHTERREKYDRDVLRLHEQRAAAGGPGPPQHRGGSYSSTGPAGGRPASGLSRRRGTFRGPPPSFYRSGGWGAHGAKRSQAHDESTSGTGSSSSGHHHDAHRHGHHHHHQQQRSASGANGYGNFDGGVGPGSEPFGGGGSSSGSSSGDMPHFDRTAKAAHTRTQGRVDEIRARNAAKKPRFPSASGDYGEVGSFFAVLAVLGVAVGLPYLVMRGWNREPEKKQKKPQG
ncbi:hypothetical protein UCDDA912_g09684 [Diaporthe ampelina]|uniref:J domain-containing protein n=1 Tax=Diaporthe ampelina TaxID=1214573 RepID=A0A0G2F849_9PEZI|nr:hypothetical protein UCDDA912_g09684 [Diaporthe ampelina]